jgi:hypothetical protein
MTTKAKAISKDHLGKFEILVKLPLTRHYSVLETKDEVIRRCFKCSYLEAGST